MAAACFALQLIHYTHRSDEHNATLKRFNFSIRHDFGFNYLILYHDHIIPRYIEQSQAFCRTFVTYVRHGQNTDLFGKRV
jgi:hypothetical protein